MLRSAGANREENTHTVCVKAFVYEEHQTVDQVRQFIDSVLQKCACVEYTLAEPVECVQASYEARRLEVAGTVVLDADRKLAFNALQEFLTQFTVRSGVAMEIQPHLEVQDLATIIPAVSTPLSEYHLDVRWICMGNMPNAGLFLIRGEYTTGFNGNSNKQLPPPGESSVNNVSGDRALLSWAHVEHERKTLNLYFAVEKDTPDSDGLAYNGYRLVLPYSSFLGVAVDCGSSREENFVYVKLRHPPQLWEAVPQYGGPRRVLNLKTCREWLRAKKWPGNSRSSGCSQRVLADSPIVGFSVPKQWVRADGPVPMECNESPNNPTRLLFEVLAAWSKSLRIRVTFAHIMQVARIVRPSYDVPLFASFRADYAIQALIGRGFIVTDQLFPIHQSAEEPLFFQRVRWCLQEHARACEDALETLLTIIDERRYFNILRVFEMFYSQKLSEYLCDNRERHSDVPPNCVLVRKAVVMPLRTIWLAPEVMMGNRVLRAFGEQYALRCAFRDDNGGRLVIKNFTRGRNLEQQSTIIPQMISSTLNDGLNIAGRQYEFLAWSNSQMRDHGCYMYTEAEVMDETSGSTRRYTVQDIRRWMGDFSATRSVPKLMSRMGQCFTQAQPSIKLRPSDVQVIADITGGLLECTAVEPYNFSDGVGLISPRLAIKIAAVLDVTPVPSCFQVRYKGFKGVLTVWPRLNEPESPKVIFRDSQKKFDDNDPSPAFLEVVKYSMPSPICLNRPLIMIVDQVSQKQNSAVHRRVCKRIEGILEEELNALAGMLYEENEACTALTNRLPTTMNYRQLSESGISLTREPFFRSLLLAVYRYSIGQQLVKSHRFKLKIPMPADKGRTLYGVIDESGVLQYGQVFVQYSRSVKQASEDCIVLQGRVMVTKNPCHVPGDIRMLDAVDVPSLRHLRDVIAFPQYGPRPHPDEMAGSDLDGDEYTVIFDEELFFVHNERPMSFPKSKSTDYNSQPTTEDMANFFLKYLHQDSIGLMSNAHLIMADRLGIYNEVCASIAAKCSVAVDFPKTGVPAEPLAPFEQSREVPDYMQTQVKPTYKSKRLIGRLYRMAKSIEDLLESIESDSISRDLAVDADLFDASLLESDPDLIVQSARIRDEYYAKLQQFLDEYGITDEASLVTGHTTTIRRITEMEKDDYSFFSAEKIVELRFHHIVKEFGDEEELFMVDQYNRKHFQGGAAAEKKAIAWYTAAYVGLGIADECGTTLP
ncbi:CBN-RRF-3 protein [Aphelenchoides avenae]|nr:CBN-RRF-3 protein [Aphelenchus avenae]